MNLKDIRTAIFSQVDWAPTQSTDATTRLNEFINRAYFLLTEEAPFLFFEKRVGFGTLADATADIPTDLISCVAGDPWVLQRDLPNTTAGLTLWDVTGRWGGRMILLTAPDGTQHRRMVREVWNEDVGGGTIHQRLTLFRPWNNATDANMNWQIYSEDYYLPDNVIEVSSIRLFKSNQNWPLDIIGQLEAEQYSLADTPSQVVQGVPRCAFRRYHRQIESPTAAPTGVLHTGTWDGPEPAGRFEYCFTYAWGYRDVDYRDFGPSLTYEGAQGNTPSRREPLWESAPSPSFTITAGTADSGANLIRLTLPDIDYMQGFGRKLSSGTGAEDPRFRHSGWRKRIYRRRHTVDATNYSSVVPAANRYLGAIEQETPDTFYLFDDIPGYQTLYTDNGNVLPDYHKRLREIHGYQSLRLYPRPNDRYQVDVRCIARPEELRDDSDVPEIHPDGMNVLIQKALGYLYEAQGNPEMADRALSRYQENLFTLTKRYGDLRYPGQTLLKRPARAGRSIDSRRPWRRWYNLPNT